MSREERHAQLLQCARELIREGGADEFTLGRLAERAGITKPVVYDHFGDRSGAFAELYRDYEAQQRAALRLAVDLEDLDLGKAAEIVGTAYIDCSIRQGRELSGVIGALACSPTLSELRREAENEYSALCREVLEPFTGPVSSAAMHAVTGAGDALARAVSEGRITSHQARVTLSRVVMAISVKQ